MKRIWVLFLLLFAVGVEGQTYPSKAIRVVVPYTPGGPADLLVRGMGQKLTETWGRERDHRRAGHRQVACRRL